MEFVEVETVEDAAVKLKEPVARPPTEGVNLLSVRTAGKRLVPT